MQTFKAMRGFKTVEDYTENYQMLEQLDKGAFGTVWRAIHKKAETPCAIKIIKKSKLSQNSVHQKLMESELKVLEETIHPNITRIFELFEDADHYFIVMELMSGGNLLQKMTELQVISERHVANIVK